MIIHLTHNLLATGGKGWFHLVGESCKSGSIKLIDSGGFAPKNLGYVAKDVDITGDDAFEFDIWDELPAGDTYQLGFYPNLDCGKATTAFSYYFTIKKKHEPSYEKNEQKKIDRIVTNA